MAETRTVKTRKTLRHASCSASCAMRVVLEGMLKLAAFPALVVVPSAITIYGIDAGWKAALSSSPELADLYLYLAVVIPAVVAIAALERIIPYRTEWNRSIGDLGTDTAHMLSGFVVYRTLQTLLLGVGAILAGRVSEAFGGSLWPHQSPLAVQLALALLIGELGHYGYHRYSHERELPWRLHATHHSSLRLYWLNANRFHWLDIVLLYSCQVLPLFVLGCGKDLFLLYGVFTIVFGYLQHANVDFKTGVLNYVFSTPDLHRWHHSRSAREGNTNYGGDLVIWDQLFGTFFYPKAKRFRGQPGVDIPGFPQTFVAQQLSPFRWERVAARAEPAPGE